LFGWPAEEIIGKPITLLLPPDRLHEEASILERLRDGKRVERFETIRVTRDGRQIPVSVSVSPMRDTEGRVIGASKVVHDISETVKAREAAAQEHQEARRAEKEIERLLTNERKARAEVERTNRMKDEFLATLSHELRTPLNAILGFSQLIEKKPGDVNAVIEGVQVITRNAKMQVDLISDLLDMSRIVSGKLRLDVKEVNLADVINAGLDAIRHSAQSRGIVIETSFPREALLARGDEGRLQQVVWNLLSNAVKFTPRRGRIRVSLKSDNGNAKIVVHDTGIGVRSDVLPYLFERFRQADSSASREHGGLGIGLAIVKHLVELHGGSVSAASEGEGKGATFTVELPLAGVPVMAPAPEPPPETAYTLPEPDEDLIDFDGLEVLAIDDQPDSRAFLTRVLEERRARVINASSAEEGLFVLKQHKPDIVLCDIGMPGVDGYQFIRTMRETGDHTPALAVTAFARPEDRLRALRAGYQGHITKPVNPAELFATIAVFVGQDKS
jgi:PAS domain S-box-containing protein